MAEKHGQHGILRLDRHGFLHRGYGLVEPIRSRQGQGIMEVYPGHLGPSGQGVFKGLERLVKLLVRRESLTLD
jgi:hypothetical protein